DAAAEHDRGLELDQPEVLVAVLLDEVVRLGVRGVPARLDLDLELLPALEERRDELAVRVGDDLLLRRAREHLEQAVRARADRAQLDARPLDAGAVEADDAAGQPRAGLRARAQGARGLRAELDLGLLL